MSMLSRFATTGGGGDPYWGNVSYLLVGNGANDTTTNIKDSSSNNLATTIKGNTVISTAQSKFRSGAVYFDGNGDYLTYSANTVLDFGAGDFTIEAWVYPIGGPTTWFLTSSIGSGGFFFGTERNGGIGFGQNGISWDYLTASFLVTGQWSYITIVRNNGLINIYVNGISIGSTSNSTSYNLSTSGMSVGSQSASFYFNGYLYDVRVTKGVARYTGSTMTVPTAPLPIG